LLVATLVDLGSLQGFLGSLQGLILDVGRLGLLAESLLTFLG
jgi:hypothetical protein